MGDNDMVYQNARISSGQRSYENHSDMSIDIVERTRHHEGANRNDDHAQGAMQGGVALLKVTLKQLLVFSIKQGNSFFVEM